ncbi:lysozyme [Xylella fastidiosa]|uniref:Lysozyme n=1 Tax=Xylella fastidiosa TaxID=2371 RepID=A0ABC8AGD5_XYLFS|nr:lysozyme [Xylella fastidiosa]ALR07629.2 lysozyme [Xylella fastidiosa]
MPRTRSSLRVLRRLMGKGLKGTPLVLAMTTPSGLRTIGSLVGKGLKGATLVLAIATPFVAYWEGLKHRPYKDIVGVWTVCYGHTGANVVIGKTYTEAECDALLQADLREANGYVRRCISVPMLPHIEASLVSATFNLGPKVVCGSTLQRKALANDWPGACAELDRWKHAAGREVRGLVLRRADERALCEGRAS